MSRRSRAGTSGRASFLIRKQPAGKNPVRLVEVQLAGPLPIQPGTSSAAASKLPTARLVYPQPSKSARLERQAWRSTPTPASSPLTGLQTAGFKTVFAQYLLRRLRLHEFHKTVRCLLVL